MSKVRVRFAPSPTGPLHIGGVRTALYNYLYAKKHGGDFILRIEDTDQTRFVEGAEDYVLDALEWCGLTPDESPRVGGEYGPYRQSERKASYAQFAEQLIASGNAYYAFDTLDELNALRKQYEAEKKTFSYDSSNRDTLNNSLTLSKDEIDAKLSEGENYVIRLLVPANEEVKFTDEIRGSVSVQTNTMDDKVIFKSDGMPTYHLANVVDDYAMKITHVIRGEEWLPSAPLHVLLYRFLGWEDAMPSFSHLPLILKPDGPGKLSKRDGDRLGFPVFPLEWKDPKSGDISTGYKEEGYFPDAFVNMLAFLGWNPGTEQEIFSIKELIAAFSLDRVGKAGAKFDPDKARLFNQEYLKAKSGSQLAEFIGDSSFDFNLLTLVCNQMKERVTFAKDIPNAGSYFFTAPTSYDEKMVKKKWKEKSPSIVTDLVSVFGGVAAFNSEALEIAFKKYVEDNELGFGIAMVAIRLTITGVGGGPNLFEIMEIIGKEESLSRMKKGIEVLG
ncbi:MAG: glutamate--tRNA ligase [Flavobacteriales bacterium]|nr:glutamate--tRNA ligase [Flavobacteriales bacterium]